MHICVLLPPSDLNPVQTSIEVLPKSRLQDLCASDFDGGFYNGATWVLDYDGPSDLMVDRRGVLMHPFLYDIL